MRSTYALLVGRGATHAWAGWRMLWKLKAQARTKVFLWVLSHDRIMTNGMCWRRGLSQSSACVRCDAEMEDGIPAIRDCSKSQEVWLAFVPPRLLRNFFSLDLKTWLLTNLSFKKLESYGGRWPEVFAQIAWNNWRWRCTEVMDGGQLPLEIRVKMTRSRIQGMEVAYATKPLHRSRE